MKKKLVCLLLAALLCMSGCTPKEEKDDTAKKPTERTPWIELTKLEDVRLKELLRKQKDKAAEEIASLPIGVVEDNTYTNTYAGFGFTADDDWTILPANELQDVAGEILEHYTESELEDYLKEATFWLDVLAYDRQMDVRVNVVFEKMPAITQAVVKNLTEEEYVDLLLAQPERLIASYERSGCEVLSVAKKEVAFLGETHFAIYIEATMYDEPYYFLQIFDVSSGKYTMNMTLASRNEDRTAEILSMFFAA